MRAISFTFTQKQILNRTKFETRRLDTKRHYLSMPVGTRLRGLDRCMGFKKGEKPITLAVIEITEISREQLEWITKANVVNEGFPDMSPADFVAMFCRHMKCKPMDFVTTIRFKYVE